MYLKGKHQFAAPANQVWQILMDADTLARITPGITKLEPIGEDQYKAIADIKMGPVSGSFAGNMEVADKQEPESFTLKVKQESRIGNVSADVKIHLSQRSENETELSFDGKANLSGLLARTGNRVLSGVANTLTKQFFKELENELNNSTAKS